MERVIRKNLIVFIVLLGFGNSFAQVDITPATGGLNICTGSTATLSDISVIANNSASDFNNTVNVSGQTFTLTLPSGFIFASVPTVSKFPSTTTRISITSATLSGTSDALIITYDLNNFNATGRGFTISAIEITALSAGASGVITRPYGGGSSNNASVVGTYLANYGLLSSLSTPTGSANISSITSICGAGTVTFKPTTISGINFNFYDNSNNLLAWNSASYSTILTSGTSKSIIISETTMFCESDPSTWVTVTGTSVANPSVPTVSGVSVCKGSGLNPTLSATGTGSQFNWYNDPGKVSLLSTSGGNFTLNPVIVTSTGGVSFNYYVSQIVNGCESSLSTASVNVLDISTSVITNLPSSLCSSSPLLLTASPTVTGGSYSFSAQNVSGPGSIINGSTVSVSGSNYYLIPNSLTGLSSTIPTVIRINYSSTVSGCVSTASQLVSITGIPTISGIVLSSQTTLCGSGSVTLTPGSISGFTFDFYDSGNSLLSSNASSFTTPTVAAGGNVVYKIAASTNGCSASQSYWSVVTVTSYNYPVTPTGTNVSVCKGSGLNPVLSVTGVGSVFKWYNDPSKTNLISTSGGNFVPNPAISTNAGGTAYNYYVSQIVNGCESSLSMASVYVQDLVQPTITNLASSYCGNSSSILLGATPTFSGSNYAFSLSVASGPGVVTNALSISGLNYYIIPSSVTGLSSITGTTVNVQASITVSGCVSTVSQNTNFFSIPSVDFALPSNPTPGKIRTTDVTFNLVGIPSGGSFSGSGVVAQSASNYIFDTRIVSVGSNSVSYTASLNGCTNSITQIIDVVTTGGIVDLQTSYCQYNSAVPITISVGNLPQPLVAGTFELVDIVGLGITGTTDGVNYSYTFDPSAVPVNQLNITQQVTVKTRKKITTLNNVYFYYYTGSPSICDFSYSYNGYYYGSISLPFSGMNGYPIAHYDGTNGMCYNSSGLAGYVVAYDYYADNSQYYGYIDGNIYPTINPFFTSQPDITQNVIIYSQPISLAVSPGGTNCTDGNVATSSYPDYSAVGAQSSGTIRWWNVNPTTTGTNFDISVSAYRVTSKDNSTSIKAKDFTGLTFTNQSTGNIRWATQDVNGCFSNPTAFTIDVYTYPGVPKLVGPVTSVSGITLAGISLCQNISTAPLMSVTGENNAVFIWYDNVVASNYSNALISNPYYTDPSYYNYVYPNTFNYFVSQTVNGCETKAPGLEIDVNILPQPSAPTITNSPNYAINGFNNNCNGSTNIVPITLTGSNSLNFVNIYIYSNNSLVGSNLPLNASASFNLNYNFATLAGVDFSNSGNYYVPVTQVQNGCESSRNYVYFYTAPIPSVPLVSSYRNSLKPYYCNSDVLFPITVSGAFNNEYSFYYSNGAPIVTLTSTGSSGFTFMPPASILGHGLSTDLIDNYLFSQTTVYGCESAKAPTSITVKPSVAIPPGTDTTVGTNLINNYCTGQSISQLKMLVTDPSYSIEWYNSSLLGTGNFIINNVNYSPSLSNSIASLNTYYAIQTLGVCKGVNYIPVSVNIFSTPSIPSYSAPPAICSGTSIPTVTATGSNIKWYLDNALTTLLGTGNIGSTSFLQMVNTVPGTFNRYITQTNNYTTTGAFSCESSSQKIDYVVYGVPATPIVLQPKIYCPNEIMSPIAVNNAVDGIANFNWYNGTVLGFSSSSVNTVNGSAFLGLSTDPSIISVTTSLGYSTTRSVTIGINGCESPASIINFSVYPLTSIPGIVFSNYNFCTNDVVQGLNVTGSNLIKWYNNFSSIPNSPSVTAGANTVAGVFSSSQQTLVTSLPTVYTFYATQTLNGCESYGTNVATITATINQLPSPPTVFVPNSFCRTQNSNLIYLFATATGASFITTWYDNTTVIGTVSGVLSSVYSGIDQATAKDISKTFTVTQTQTFLNPIKTCTSLPSSIPIQLYDLPTYSFGLTDTVYCGNSSVINISNNISSSNLSDLYGGFYIGSNSITGIFDPLSTLSGFSQITADYKTFPGFNPNTKVLLSGRASYYLGSRLTSYTTGCSRTQYKRIYIDSIPRPDFAIGGSLGNGRLIYCNNEKGDTILAVPTSGQVRNFTGEGILNNKFIPSVVNNQVQIVKPYTVPVTFEYKDNNNNGRGCSNTVGYVLTVNPVPVLSIPPFQSQGYCVNASPITLTGSFVPLSVPGASMGGFGYFSATSSVTGPNTISTVAGTYVFDFTKANVLDTFSTFITHPVTYTVGLPNAYNTCYNTANSSIKVNKLPNPSYSIYGLVDFNGKARSTIYGVPDSVCKDLALTLNLIPKNAGGIFTINALANSVLGTSFRPSDYPDGNYMIKYAYTDPTTGCKNESSQQLDILALPVPIFTQSSYCQGDTISFSSQSYVNGNDQIIKWKWGLQGGISPIPSDSVSVVRTVFNSYSNFNISLYVKSKYGCSNSTVTSVNIGPYPEAIFKTKNICFNDTTFLTDNSKIAIGQIKSKTWFFGDSDSLSITPGGVITGVLSVTGKTYVFTPKYFGHQYSNTGTYFQRLKVVSQNNCTSYDTVRTYIVPKIVVTAANQYIQDFESGDGGYVASSQNTSWQYGTPDKKHIKGGASGLNAWVTSLTGTYKRGDKTYVQCPCFDFSAMQKPMISLKIRSNMPQNIDGVVLQASDTDDDNSWVNVGSINSDNGAGINWYNAQGIQGNPGSQLIGQYGWSYADSLGDWRTSRYKLDKITNYMNDTLSKTSMRFRVILGSTESTVTGLNSDGFAFDDFSILERDKLSLVEYFSSSAPTTLLQNEQTMYDIVNNNRTGVVAVNYHMSTNSFDEFNKLNIADPSAKSLYYGVSSPPYLVFNGNQFNSDYIGGLKQSIIDTLGLQSAKFDINLGFTSASGNTYTINTTITAKDSVSDETILNLALVERQVNGNLVAANSNVKFEWIMRKLVPDAAGTSISQSWTNGIQRSYTYSASLNKVFDNAQVGVVAFIQNKNSKEIYQTAYAGPMPIIGVVNDVTSKTESGIGKVEIYPNPAQDVAYVLFDNMIQYNVQWGVYDQIGRYMEGGTIHSGSVGFSLNTSNYATGMYFIGLKSENSNQVVYKKVIVVK